MKRNWRKWWKSQYISLPSNNPCIIFEGVDGSGKSTWEEILSEIFGHTFFFHTSAPYNNMPKTYYYNLLKSFLETAKMIHQPLFIDRFHIGELVYGSVFRPNNVDEEIELKMYEMEEELLSKLNAKTVYVTATPDVIRHRIATRGDWYIKPGNVENLLQLYDEKLAKSKLPIFVLDTTNPIKDETVLELIKFIYS